MRCLQLQLKIASRQVLEAWIPPEVLALLIVRDRLLPDRRMNMKASNVKCTTQCRLITLVTLLREPTQQTRALPAMSLKLNHWPILM